MTLKRFEDTKGAIRRGKSKKETTMTKQIPLNDNLQSITRKTRVSNSTKKRA